MSIRYLDMNAAIREQRDHSLNKKSFYILDTDRREDLSVMTSSGGCKKNKSELRPHRTRAKTIFKTYLRPDPKKTTFSVIQIMT